MGSEHGRGSAGSQHFSGNSARGRELRRRPRFPPCFTPPGWRGAPRGSPRVPAGREEEAETSQPRGQSLHPRLGAGAAL